MIRMTRFQRNAWELRQLKRWEEIAAIEPYLLILESEIRAFKKSTRNKVWIRRMVWQYEPPGAAGIMKGGPNEMNEKVQTAKYFKEEK